MGYRTMITKKQRIMGAEIALSMTPLGAIRDFFGAVEKQPSTIPLYSKKYREYRTEAGKRGLPWKGISTGADKQRLSLKRIKASRERGGF